VPTVPPASPQAPPRVTVEDLLARLTLPERIAMLHQYSPAVPRLGLAAFRTGTEALHGVAWLGHATVFPQAVGLGATWNPELLQEVGEATSVQVRAKHATDPTVSLNVWAPVVNLLRDPRWGRNEEGYSEDPWLTGLLATAYCRGLRGDHPDVVRTAPTLKHFLAYNNESDRTATSSSVRPRVLHEYDLPAFRAPIRAGVVDAVMPAYNLVNGRPCHVSPYLAQGVRAWAPHELLVVSDAQAPSNLVEDQRYFPDHPTAHAAALRAGVDSFTDHGADPATTVARLTEALHRGLIGPDDIDRAVRRVLALRARTGEFEPERDPYAGIGPDALERPEHRELARRAAREQVVLLRNDGQLLPLAAARLRRLAVVGPFAQTLCEDWYSGTMPYRVDLTAGLAEAIAVTGGTVVTAEGADRIALRSRRTGRYVVVADADVPALTCTDAPHRAAVPDGTPPPEPAQFDVFGWSGDVLTLRSVLTGRYVTAQGGALVADREQPGGWVVHETFTLEPRDDGVLLRCAATGAYAAAGLDGVLATTADRPADAEVFERVVVHDGVAQALAVADGADVVVLAVGNDPHIDGRETQDRSTLSLPPTQDRLVHELAAEHEDVVLVVMSSYPYALGWADEHIAAVMWTSHAGQETGHAVADVLLGRHAPSGRLPQTWYRADADLPDLLEYDVISGHRTYQYLDVEPLYPFGHGLTYATFRYGPATAVVDGPAGAETVSVTLDVTNIGNQSAPEVVQLYSRPLGTAEPDRPRRRLQAFVRVPLGPGETRTVVLAFPLEQLTHWDVVTHGFRIEPGAYELLVGRSCDVIESVAHIDVPGEPRGPRPVTVGVVAAVDFDAAAGVRIVDTTPASGEAVEVVDDGWLLLRRALLPGGRHRLTARVSRTEPGTARLDLRADDPHDGRLLGGVDVPGLGGRYVWAEVAADVRLGDETTVRDLFLVLTGAQRLDHVRLAPILAEG